MKTVFIINPKAGKKKDVEKLSQDILFTAKKINKEVEIYITRSVGDAGTFAKNYAKEKGNARFIACGGDGTLSEVVNGIYGFEGVEVGVMPMGTGNDFCRNFPSELNFSDIEAQLLGNTQKCDLIKYTTQTPQGIRTGYCVNMFNVGFDCNVADTTNRLKKKPLISGSMAYLLSIFCILVKKKGANLTIDIDGKRVHSGALLLTSIANGSYCGGGVKSNPTALVNDGVMDVNIINNVSRLTFVSKLPYYMKGTHMGVKNIEKIITCHRCKNMTITPEKGKMRLCADGEIFDAGKTEFEVAESGFSFVLP